MSSSPKQGQIEIDEAEAKLVKDIFKLRSKGLSLAKIGAKYGFSKQKVDYILKNKNYYKLEWINLRFIFQKNVI